MFVSACSYTVRRCVNSLLLSFLSALRKIHWSALVTGRYIITMMVLLCCVNLSGMSLKCTVIVLMNNSLLGGQECTDNVAILQNSDDVMGHNTLAIIPRLNFTCNGRITSIAATVAFNKRDNFPFVQVWRAASVNSTVYNKIGEAQLPRERNFGGYSVANITLTGNSTIEVQSGDVVGYYHPPESRLRVRTIQTRGYRLYQFRRSHESVDLNNNMDNDDNRQPLIQFTIGKFNVAK